MPRFAHRRTLLLLLGVLTIPLLAWGVYFSVLVVKNVRLIKGGKNPTLLASELAKQASIARSIQSAQVTAEDLKRIEPIAHEPTLGNPKAAVHIVEFVDYQCPFCQRAAPVIRDFLRRHEQDAFFLLRDFPILELHPEAESVAVAARCVFDQNNSDRFWRAHDLLFADQAHQSQEDLRRLAARVGADLAEFDACVASGRPLAHIRQSFADGVAVGVRGTPTFFFNGVKIQGAIDAESLELIFQEIKKQTSS